MSHPKSPKKIKTRISKVKPRGNILVLFDGPQNYALDYDYIEELKLADWETEADVMWALESLHYDVELQGVYDDTNLIRQSIEKFKPEIVFNLMEAFCGNSAYDRNIAAFLELMNVPYTGCGPVGLTLCKNKGISKKILSYHRIHVPHFATYHRNKKVSEPKNLRYPLFIKPLNEEASYGISQASFVENDQQFLERIKFVHEKMDQDVIAEEYIPGRELYVSVLGNKRLFVPPIRELKFREVPPDEPRFASFKAKWDMEYRKKWGISNGFCDPLPNGMVERIGKLCKKIYRLLGINGYARMDLRLTPEGKVYFIEANPNPVLTSDEDFAESAKKADIPYSSLLQRIINLAKHQVQ